MITAQMEDVINILQTETDRINNSFENLSKGVRVIANITEQQITNTGDYEEIFIEVKAQIEKRHTTASGKIYYVAKTIDGSVISLFPTNILEITKNSYGDVELTEDIINTNKLEPNNMFQQEMLTYVNSRSVAEKLIDDELKNEYHHAENEDLLDEHNQTLQVLAELGSIVQKIQTRISNKLEKEGLGVLQRKGIITGASPEHISIASIESVISFLKIEFKKSGEISDKTVNNLITFLIEYMLTKNLTKNK